MGLTGRYDFKGIQKLSGRLIDGLLVGTGWGAWLLASPFKPIVNLFRDLIINFLANRGIILLNVIVNDVTGEIDQAAFDKSIDEGLRKVLQGRDKITPKEGQAIDDNVRKAFDKSADLGAADPIDDEL